MESTEAVHVPDHVVLREFDTETVVLDLDTGTYHSVNATGGRFGAAGRLRRIAPGEPSRSVRPSPFKSDVFGRS